MENEKDMWDFLLETNWSYYIIEYGDIEPMQKLDCLTH